METDYENYAIVYSDKKTIFGEWRYAWINARHPIISQNLLESLFKRLTELTGIKSYEMSLTLQQSENNAVQL